MSQNTVSLVVNTVPLLVIVGWDRPLQQLFCSVDPQTDDDAELDKLPDDFFALSLQQFGSAADIQEALLPLGVQLPAALLASVDGDMRDNKGNVIRRYSPEGALLSSFGE